MRERKKNEKEKVHTQQKQSRKLRKWEVKKRKNSLETKRCGECPTRFEVGNERSGIEWGGMLVGLSTKNADGVLQCTSFGCGYSNQLRLEECRGMWWSGVSFPAYLALFLRSQSCLTAMARTWGCIEVSFSCRCFRGRILLASQISGSPNQR